MTAACAYQVECWDCDSGSGYDYHCKHPEGKGDCDHVAGTDFQDQARERLG
nr:hypothetical protein [Candidatus Sigynarchaeota archaeon]